MGEFFPVVLWPLLKERKTFRLLPITLCLILLSSLLYLTLEGDRSIHFSRAMNFKFPPPPALPSASQAASAAIKSVIQQPARNTGIRAIGLSSCALTGRNLARLIAWIGVCLSGESRRLAGVWKEESVVARGLKIFLTLVAVVFPIACSPQPQTHPLDTAPIPTNARILEEPCSPLGAMMCGAVSILSGETAVERRSACIIYVEPSGGRVEQCGSLPASHP